MELKTSFDFDFKAKSINNNTFESNVFVSHIDCNNELIACSGNGFVKLYDINNGEVNTYFGTGQKALSDMNFANKHQNLLCTSSSINGVIAIYDIKSNNKQNSKSKSKRICLLHSPNKQNKALYSVTMDNNIIVGCGKKDIYIWDKRKLQNNNNTNYTLNSYHSEDVTKVRFNTFNENNIDNHLFSVSEDNLMNEYNLLNKEDDVLINTYSFDKELWNFGFFHDHKNNHFIYTLSNDDSLFVQKINQNHNNNDNHDNDDNDDNEQKDNNDNHQETEICKFKSKTLDYMTLIDCFYDYNNYKKLCLLSCNEQGKLRLSIVSHKNVTVLSESNDGHKARIRCAKYIDKIGCFFTGGEDNKISMWKFDPINIKTQQIISTNNNNSTKIITMNDQALLSGYCAQRTSNSYNNNKKKTKNKHFSPY